MVFKQRFSGYTMNCTRTHVTKLSSSLSSALFTFLHVFLLHSGAVCRLVHLHQTIQWKFSTRIFFFFSSLQWIFRNSIKFCSTFYGKSCDSCDWGVIGLQIVIFILWHKQFSPGTVFRDLFTTKFRFVWKCICMHSGCMDGHCDQIYIDHATTLDSDDLASSLVNHV